MLALTAPVATGMLKDEEIKCKGSISAKPIKIEHTRLFET
jgi:hypothetical protein